MGKLWKWEGRNLQDPEGALGKRLCQRLKEGRKKIWMAIQQTQTESKKNHLMSHPAMKTESVDNQIEMWI